MADELQQMALQQNQRMMQAMGNKPAFLFGVIPLDWNAAGPFSMQSVSPMQKMVVTGLSTGKSGGAGDKFLQACMAARDEFGKMAAECKVMYDGPTPGGSIHTGGGHGLGGMGMGGGQELA